MTQITETHITVHENQLIVDARQFQSWRNGIPEWIKNASDAYEGASVNPEDRVILVISAKEESSGRAVLACLDFVGMSESDLKDKLSDYGNPDVAGQGEKILGGHGNGGKLYAVGGFEEGVVWHTLRDNLHNVYGLKAPRRPFLGFQEDELGNEIRSVASSEPAQQLEMWLNRIGLRIQDLPGAAQKVGLAAGGFTLVVGSEPVSLGSNFKHTICSALEGHPQMRIPVETSLVFVMDGRTILNDSEPLRLHEIPPYAGFEEPLVYDIPMELIDDWDQSVISMVGSDDETGYLELRTSDQPMVSKALKARHTLDFLQGPKTRGTEQVRDLVGKGASSDRIYGRCVGSAIEEKYEDQLRGPLVDAPYTRALRSWVVGEILELAEKMNDAALSQQKSDENAKRSKKLVDQMAKLNSWINGIITEISLGFGLEDEEGFGGPKSGLHRTSLPSDEVGRISISIDSHTAGMNIPIRFSTEFYGVDGTTRVRPVAISWRSSDPEVADFSPLTGMINTYKRGNCDIWCESAEGVRSNSEEVRVKDFASLELDTEELELRVGERRKVSAAGITHEGDYFEDIRLHWDSNDEAIRVGLAGVVTGVEEGEAILVAREGDGTQATCNVRVRPADTDHGGPSRPRYLLSEVQMAPYDEEPPWFHQDEGLVVQRTTKPDVEHNIWWINRASRLARFVSVERGIESEQWFLYLAERMADAAIEASLMGADRGTEPRPVSETLENAAQLRNQILESFMAEFGSTNQLIV